MVTAEVQQTRHQPLIKTGQGLGRLALLGDTPRTRLMTPVALNDVATKWFAAFNVKDLDALLALYHDDAEHFSPKLKVRHPETKGLICGKAALRTWWGDAFRRLPTLHYHVVRLTPYEDRVFMEYVRRVDAEEDLYVGEMLEITNGLIVRSSVFHQ